MSTLRYRMEQHYNALHGGWIKAKASWHFYQTVRDYCYAVDQAKLRIQRLADAVRETGKNTGLVRLADCLTLTSKAYRVPLRELSCYPQHWDTHYFVGRQLERYLALERKGLDVLQQLARGVVPAEIRIPVERIPEQPRLDRPAVTVNPKAQRVRRQRDLGSKLKPVNTKAPVVLSIGKAVQAQRSKVFWARNRVVQTWTLRGCLAYALDEYEAVMNTERRRAGLFKITTNPKRYDQVRWLRWLVNDENLSMEELQVGVIAMLGQLESGDLKSGLTDLAIDTRMKRGDYKLLQRLVAKTPNPEQYQCWTPKDDTRAWLKHKVLKHRAQSDAVSYLTRCFMR